MDILFNQGSLTWDTFAANRKAKLNELAAKFAGLSLEDLENFKWWTGFDDNKMLVNPDAAALADYLFAVQIGEITSDILSSEKAKELKMTAFAALFDRENNGSGLETLDLPIKFAFDGTESFSGLCLYGPTVWPGGPGNTLWELCSGITGEQLSQCKRIEGRIRSLDNVSWTGEEDLSGVENISGVENFGSMPSNVLVSGNWGCATIIDRDISGVSLEYFKGSFDRCDLSKSNITKDQVLKLMDSSLGLYYSKLPTITFDGSEDFTGKRLIGVDMSSLVGITPKQILSTKTIQGAVLPKMTFTGNEDLSVFAKVGGAWDCDWSRCSGITAEQIITSLGPRVGSNRADWDIVLSSSQYNAMKDKLAAVLDKGNSKRIYINDNPNATRYGVWSESIYDSVDIKGTK